MLYYHFTNDTRFKELKNNLYSMAKYIEYGKWEHEQTKEQAKNGWYPLYEIMFGLYEGSHNVKLILNKQFEDVLVEFVKKFQFPNPKKNKNGFYNKEKENEQLVAPLRVLVKLLYIKYLQNEESAIEIESFYYYILSNKDLVQSKTSIVDLYYQIKNDTISSKRKKEYFQKNVEVSGGNNLRFSTQLLGIIDFLPFINYENKKIKLTIENIDYKNMRRLYDILSYNEYWTEKKDTDFEQDFKEYMQSNVPLKGSEISISNVNNQFRQCIYFGAPGTGKSYHLNEESKIFNSNNVKRVTFHPHMTYGQFVGTYKPISENENIKYRYTPGPLMEQIINAILFPNENYLLIIEEMNRANVSAVFGEVFQLLDRNNKGDSEYPIHINEDLKNYLLNDLETKTEKQKEIIDFLLEKGLFLPKNLFLWSTINTADQGVMPMDTAFKRRWEQKYFGIDEAYYENLEAFKNYCKIISSNFNRDSDLIEWNQLRVFLNNQLLKLNVQEDKLMGPYFLSEAILSSSNEILTESFKNKVLIYLFEDVVKMKRNDFFDLPLDKLIFSEIIKSFDEIGIRIFKNSEEILK